MVDAFKKMQMHMVIPPFSKGFIVGTLPETNIAPEIRPPQKETNLPTIHF